MTTRVLLSPVAFAHFGRQLQHPHEHGRNPLAVETSPKVFECGEGRLGIEPFHDERRTAKRMNGAQVLNGAARRSGAEEGWLASASKPKWDEEHLHHCVA